MGKIKDQNSQPIEITPKNILILAIVLFSVIVAVYYTYADSKKSFDKRMAKYNDMTTREMAVYLADLNAVPEQLDPITRHAGTSTKDTTINFYRELTSNIFSNLIVDVENIKDEKLKMSKQLKREMCNSPTYTLFYEKGGALLYIYHQVKNNKKNFLFDVRINKSFCL